MSKPRLLITRDDYPRTPLFDEMYELFDVYAWPCLEKGRMPQEEFERRLKGCAAVILVPNNTIGKEVLDKCGENLKVVVTNSGGFDHLDVKEIKSRGIRVGHVGDVQKEFVAEYNIGLALAAGRRFEHRRQFIVSGEWARRQTTSLQDYGFSLIQSTVGIIGLGQIGLETAKMLKPFKVDKILYTSRSVKTEGTDIGAERVSLQELLKQSDFIFLTCALTKDNINLIGTNEFKLMKPTAIFINTARGGLVDQDALVEALQNKRIAGAAIDVMIPEPLPADNPLCKLDNCILQPHASVQLERVRLNMSTITAKNVIEGFRGNAMAAEL